MIEQKKKFKKSAEQTITTTILLVLRWPEYIMEPARVKRTSHSNFCIPPSLFISTIPSASRSFAIIMQKYLIAAFLGTVLLLLVSTDAKVPGPHHPAASKKKAMPAKRSILLIFLVMKNWIRVLRYFCRQRCIRKKSSVLFENPYPFSRNRQITPRWLQEEFKIRNTKRKFQCRTNSSSAPSSSS